MMAQVPNPSNPASAAEAAGAAVPAQHWDPARYRRNAAFVAELGMPVVELLAPRPAERILDLGCGDGALTAKLARLATVVGVDASAEQIAAARALGLDARVVDGAALSFDNEFDAVFSNATLHWMRAADSVIDGVWRALKPGGRFVAECGGAGNVEAIRSALYAALAARGIDAVTYDPWTFAGPEDYRAKLERRGFRVATIELIPRPTRLPGRLADWLDTFAESFLAALPPEDRPALKDSVEAALRPVLCDRGGGWTADYVRLRFAAVKPTGAGA
jgi:SAM-dependent methyltransferase